MAKIKSIRKKLILIVLLPIVILGILTILVGATLLYQFYTQSIYDEVTATTNMMIDCLDLTVRGDYSYENGMLLKGDINISDSTMLYRVKEESQIDTTIFWQDTRILTTIENEYGVSAVGTKASKPIINAVLVNGENYFSNQLEINGVKYIGYYIPLKNSNQEIVGMVFAGKKKSLVHQQIRTLLIWFVTFSLSVIIVALIFTIGFSNRITKDIDSINQFLKTISDGNLNAVLDPQITKRNDEIGAIGMFASKMRSDLHTLIEKDSLTSLYNRRSCNHRLQELTEKNINYSVVMCDIDWFKKINDTYGHDAGDYVLVELSSLIQENIENIGFASRWGGEEFLLVYQQNFEETKQKIEHLQQTIRTHEFTYHATPIHVTMTFGIHPKESEVTFEETIKEADKKLYIGKNNGRNQIVC